MFSEYFKRLAEAFRKNQPIPPTTRLEMFCIGFGRLPCMEDIRIMHTAKLIALPDWYDHIDPTFDQLNLVEIAKDHIKNYLTISVSWKVLFFLAMVSVNPTSVVMYVAYLQYWGYQKNQKAIDFINFQDIFPYGLPDESSLKDAWYGQKVYRDGREYNLLDDKAAYEPIQFPRE